MGQRLEKATITVLDGRDKGSFFKVLFNPTEYSYDLSNNFQEIALPGLGNPILQFVNGNSQQLTMELLFDTWTINRGEDVSNLTRRFSNLLLIDSDLHAPSPVSFLWGSFEFTAVIPSLSQRFTMFDANGTPVRATLNVTFKQYRPLSQQLKEPRRNSADKTKRRVLNSDDSLWAMAFREYGDVSYWRLIAQHNRIARPREVVAGTVLVLPPLEEK